MAFAPSVVVLSLRERGRGGRLTTPWRAIVAAVLLQVALGIATLLLRVPVSIAALHQLGAVVLLTASMWAAARTPTFETSER